MPNFDASIEEAHLIRQIVDRFKLACPDDPRPALFLQMDITACHCNGTPLRLSDLLNSGDQDFLHDVAGICSHIDRRTGKIGDCFSPRYSK